MSAIDDQITDFFNRKACLSWDIEDYEKRMREYEAFRYKYPAWVMRNGEPIRIYHMTDEHLANTISLVGRKDPKNETGLLEVLRHEQEYRRLSKMVVGMKSELADMEYVSDMCL